MANESSITTLQFKRGTKANLENLLVGSNIPLNGEPIYEMDTNKMKIGDGVHSYAALPYFVGNTIEIYYIGYYLNGKFYTDSTYTTELPKDNQRIYVDQNSFMFYKYYGDLYGFKPVVTQATDVTPGIMKLYNVHGTHEDGTMTQKAITDGVNAIKFGLETTADEDGDGDPENILVLDLPWLV